jgi:hypothetical protein
VDYVFDEFTIRTDQCIWINFDNFLAEFFNVLVTFSEAIFNKVFKKSLMLFFLK